MKLGDLGILRPGHRVRFSLACPRGAALVGTVTRASLNYLGHHFVTVEWDGQEGYLRFSSFSSGWPGCARRLALAASGVSVSPPPP